MTTNYEAVRRILDLAVNGENFGGHGPFWRGMTRDEFVKFTVFGKKLVSVGNSDTSNIIMALSGLAPFGQDIKTPGAFYRRMPAGRPPVSDEDIEYIKTWINEGCPELDTDNSAISNIIDITPHDTFELHNSYWRDFDDWAMFNATERVQNAIFRDFAPKIGYWVELVKNNIQLSEWEIEINKAPVIRALKILSELQINTLRKYYGDPVNEDSILESYAMFEAGKLPQDTLRPIDPDHNMNGEGQWSMWLAFADACYRTQTDNQFWAKHSRAILLGMMCDGVIRKRFTVVGFEDTNPTVITNMKDYVAQIHDDQLWDELRRRIFESGVYP